MPRAEDYIGPTLHGYVFVMSGGNLVDLTSGRRRGLLRATDALACWLLRLGRPHGRACGCCIERETDE